VSLSVFTPSDVFFDRVREIVNRRQSALDQISNARPERFPKGRPEAKLPPTLVAIDPQSVYAHDDGWHDTCPLNPLRHLEKPHRMHRSST
jgi:hypothetical protein